MPNKKMNKTIQLIGELLFKLDPKSLEEKQKTKEKVSLFNLDLILTIVKNL